MKKSIVLVAVLSLAILTFGVAGYAYAQSQTPPAPEWPGRSGAFGQGEGYGPGMMGAPGSYAQGMMGYQGGHGMMGWNGEEGPMHDAMVSSLADALGLSPEEVEARHDAGETLWDIAEAEGLSTAEIQELMDSAHDFALEDAVANGWLTEEQAEWMDGHMQQMWEGNGAYGGHCGGGQGAGTSAMRGGMNW